jgi:acyl-CoA reductase-like NAD-dependent aldehyde dehydrogenase
VELFENFVGGNRIAVEAEEKLEVPDPATGELLGQVPLSGTSDVLAAWSGQAGS